MATRKQGWLALSFAGALALNVFNATAEDADVAVTPPRQGEHGG